ncbi:L-lactate permease [Kocuria kalidii]|uniref:L-lactate permease n=1 Tax=Kocuria kalidii TaxID=3376283 RepID=UPI0037A76DF0
MSGTGMQALLAAAPVLVVLVLMTVAGWSAARAGIVTAVVTLVLAVSAFGFGGAADPFTAWSGSAGVLAEASFIALTVVGIIGPALGIHHLQQRTGAALRLRSGLARLHPDPRLGALLVAWFFALFLEGAAGFGTPVALAAPFLVAAGMPPLHAVTAAMIGHAAGVSFGAVGTPVLAQTALVDFTGAELARATVPYHVVLGGVLMAAVVLTVGRAFGDARGLWAWGAFAAAAFLVPYGAIAAFVGPELPTLGGALVGFSVFALVLVRRRGRIGAEAGPGAAPRAAAGGLPGAEPVEAREMPMVLAAAPYLVLVALVLATRLVPPLRDALRGVVLEWETATGFSGSVLPLFHPAVLLTAAFVIGALLQRASGREIRGAFVVATRQLGPVVVALVAMVTIARTMSHAGMTDELAYAAAGAGAAWPLVAPAVGAFGTFVTGSATASNVLFTELQATTAEAVDLPVLPLLGAQGFGAAVGNLICPHNIVAAVATVGLTGQEGRVLRSTFPTAAIYVVLGGVLALLLAR